MFVITLSLSLSLYFIKLILSFSLSPSLSLFLSLSLSLSLFLFLLTILLKISIISVIALPISFSESSSLCHHSFSLHLHIQFTSFLLPPPLRHTQRLKKVVYCRRRRCVFLFKTLLGDRFNSNYFATRFLKKIPSPKKTFFSPSGTNLQKLFYGLTRNLHFVDTQFLSYTCNLLSLLLYYSNNKLAK